MDDYRVQAMFERWKQEVYLFSYSDRIIANFQNELFELMVLSILYPNQISSETLKNSNRTKQVWIWHLTNLNT